MPQEIKESCHLMAEIDDGRSNLVRKRIDRLGPSMVRRLTDRVDPLSRATEHGHRQIARDLVNRAGLDPGAAGKDALSPGAIAAQEGHAGILQDFIDAGFDPVTEAGAAIPKNSVIAWAPFSGDVTTLKTIVTPDLPDRFEKLWGCRSPWPQIYIHACQTAAATAENSDDAAEFMGHLARVGATADLDDQIRGTDLETPGNAVLSAPAAYARHFVDNAPYFPDAYDHLVRVTKYMATRAQNDWGYSDILALAKSIIDRMPSDFRANGWDEHPLLKLVESGDPALLRVYRDQGFGLDRIRNGPHPVLTKAIRDAKHDILDYLVDEERLAPSAYEPYFMPPDHNGEQFVDVITFARQMSTDPDGMAEKLMRLKEISDPDHAASATDSVSATMSYGTRPF